MSDSWRPVRYAITHNAKLANAGPAAAWLYLGGLVYAHQQATNGHLNGAIIGSLVAGYGPKQLSTAVQKLLDHGLWEPDPGGFYIHDWDEENEPAERLKQRRQANRDRQATYRHRHPVTPLQSVTVTRDANAK
jgi:hypothetical protein